MKCPFCGHDSKNQICEKCYALIPAEKPKEEPKEDEPTRVYRKKSKE